MLDLSNKTKEELAYMIERLYQEAREMSEDFLKKQSIMKEKIASIRLELDKRFLTCKPQ